jgi:hypothetical protein
MKMGMDKTGAELLTLELTLLIPQGICYEFFYSFRTELQV